MFCHMEKLGQFKLKLSYTHSVLGLAFVMPGLGIFHSVLDYFVLFLGIWVKGDSQAFDTEEAFDIEEMTFKYGFLYWKHIM